ncbi:response regulator [Microvirga lotononidis]|uniref:histidine kinase n=1 Tax=Microvirga lotononidis TaxID=864069 RepID=I4YMF1_9HYPH|nr:response regulator [Microvirga lotononidis]EIM25143.1 response regulator with CheY-like receiver, AAA-type ATPase, and DNA-binding domains [Microvirga lotononidis]WQO29369.1 response regulator [Microvirga lotononidis]
MHLLPVSLKLSLLSLSGALIMSGFALAAAAYVRNSALIAAAAGLFLLIAAGAPLLIGRQIKQAFRHRDDGASDEFTVFDDVTAAPFEPPAETLLSFAEFSAFEEAPAPEEDDALRRLQKAQAVDRLRDGIAHDLNNRLMVISANIDAAARQLKDQPILQRKLLSALVASDQAAKLIAQSTAFARQGEAKVQYVNIAEQVSSVADLLSHSLLRDTVELRVSLAEDLWSIKANPDDIQTAIVTLSAHVRDALPQGGTITLEARNVQVEKGSLPDLTREGDFVQLAIRSAGLSEEVRHAPETDLEQSFSVRDLDLSSWLSLRQSLHFLQDLGGASEVRRDGGETSILLYIPRTDAATLLPSNSLNEDDTPDESVQGHTEILVVDDELEVALALQSTLEEFGYVTSIATDAAQAVKSLSVRRPALVLADVAMPGSMNGVMLAREVRQVFPSLPVLLITGNPDVAGGDSEFPLLQKPIVSRDLHVAIQRHLNVHSDNKVIPLFPRTSRRAR